MKGIWVNEKGKKLTNKALAMMVIGPALLVGFISSNHTSNLEEEVKGYEQEITALKKEVSQTTKQLNEKEKELSQLQKEIYETVEKETEKVTEKKENEIATLKEENEKLIKEKDAKIEELQASYDKLSEEKQSLATTSANEGAPTSPTNSSSVQPTEENEPHIYYANCSEAKAAGAAPIRRGEPGYAAHLDRDGDGVACE